MTLKRFALLGALLAAGTIADGAWLSRLPRWASPDLVLLVVVAAGVRRGLLVGAIAGAAAGYLRDVAGGSPLGVFSLSYLIVGTLAGTLAEVVDLGQRYLDAAMAALATLVHSAASGMVVAAAGLAAVDWPALLLDAAGVALLNALLARPVAGIVGWADTASHRRYPARVVVHRVMR